MWHPSTPRWAAVLIYALLAFATSSTSLPSPCSSLNRQGQLHTSSSFQGAIVQCPHHHQHHHRPICGSCPPGMQRKAIPGPYCGVCVPIRMECPNAHFLNDEGICQSCPCLGKNHGERRFGTSCRINFDGEVVCDCPSEHQQHCSCPAGCNCLENCAPLRNFLPIEQLGSQSKHSVYLIALFLIIILFC